MIIGTFTDKQQDSHTTDGLPTLKVQTFSEDSIKLLPPIPAKVSQLPPPESAKSKKHSSMIKPKINYAEMSLEKDEESFDSSCNSRSDITYRPVLIWKPGNPRPLSPCQPPPQPQLNSGGFSPNMHDKVKEKDSTVREDRRTPLMVYRTDLTQTLPPHKGHHKVCGFNMSHKGHHKILTWVTIRSRIRFGGGGASVKLEGAA